MLILDEETGLSIAYTANNKNVQSKMIKWEYVSSVAQELIFSPCA